MAGTEKVRNTSYADIMARLDRARNMDVNSFSADAVDKRIQLIMDGYHTVVIKVQLNGIYRARKNSAEKPWEHVSQLWYPPASAVLTRGRFNEPGAPVFYACNDATGAIFEVRPKVGDLITLLVVRTKEPVAELDSAHIGLERSLAPEMGETQRGQMLRNNPRFQAKLKHHGLSKKWLAVDEFLSEMATALFPPEQEQDKFKITNAISRLLFKIPNVQALNYPSVATKLNGLNLCLQPEIVDQYFMPSEAWMIRIEDVKEQLPGLNEPGPFFQTTFVRKSAPIEQDGHIRWSGILQNVQPEDIAHLTYRPRLPTY